MTYFELAWRIDTRSAGSQLHPKQQAPPAGAILNPKRSVPEAMHPVRIR